MSTLLSQKDTFEVVRLCKKSSPEDVKLVLKSVQAAVGDIKALQNKEPKLTNHVRTVADGFGIFGWVAQPIINDEWKEEVANAINFYGFKVLQLKQDADTAWQKAYIAVAKAFIDFVEDNKEATEWAGTGNVAEVLPQVQASKSQQSKPAAAANLLAEIQEKTLSANLKHVEKNAYKKDPSSAPEIPQPKAPVPKAAAAKEEVKRPPTKEFKSNFWYVQNYGKEVLKFEGEDVQMNYGWALIKCQDTTIVIDGKFKTIMLENCSNVKVILSNVMANMEVINCKKITVTIKESCPHISLERTQGIHIYLFPPAKGAKIHSTCSQSMVVHYPRVDAAEDDEWLDIAIPETNVTHLKGDRLMTEALEGME